MQQRLLFDDRRPPLMLVPNPDDGRTSSDLAAWLSAETDRVQELLAEYGALLFRGFELRNAADFQRALLTFQGQLADYLGGHSPREKVIDQVYTSTHYPAGERITLHSELAFLRQPPRYLAFFCEIPPAEGGETPIIDTRRLLQILPESVVGAFSDRPVIYLSRFHDGIGLGRSWQESFETDDRTVVEATLSAQEGRFQWREDGSLELRYTRPAIRPHPVSGEPLWFNNVCLFHLSDRGAIGRMIVDDLGEQALPTNALFEGEEPIDPELLDPVRRLSWSEASFFSWQAGDLLLVDNYLIAHGRNRFTGDRRVLVAMA